MILSSKANLLFFQNCLWACHVLACVPRMNCCYTSGTKFLRLRNGVVYVACKQSLTSNMSPSMSSGIVFHLTKKPLHRSCKIQNQLNPLPSFSMILLSHPSSKSHGRLGTSLGQENILYCTSNNPSNKNAKKSPWLMSGFLNTQGLSRHEGQ